MENSLKKVEKAYADWLVRERPLSDRVVSNYIYTSRYVLKVLGLKWIMIFKEDHDLEKEARKYVCSDVYRKSPKYTERHIIRMAKLMSEFVEDSKAARKESEEQHHRDRYLHPEKYFQDDVMINRYCMSDFIEFCKSRFIPGRTSEDDIDAAYEEWKENIILKTDEIFMKDKKYVLKEVGAKPRKKSWEK